MDATNIDLEYLTMRHTDDLCVLYRKVFGKTVDQHYFELKYGLKDEERIQSSTVAYIDEQIIGFYGCISVEFCDKTRKTVVSAGSVCDFILLEEFRGTGIFDRLYRHTLERCEEEQMEYVFGFQSEQTWRLSARYGWKDTPGFSSFQLSFRHHTMSLVQQKLRGTDKMRQRVEQALGPFLIHSDLDTFNRLNDRFTMRYDASFLQEKSFCPHYLIEVEGVTMWMKYERTLVAGFIRFSDHFNAETFVQTLKNVLTPTGISDLTIHVWTGSPEYEILCSFLEASPSLRVSYLRLSENAGPFEELALNFMDADFF